MRMFMGGSLRAPGLVLVSLWLAACGSPSLTVDPEVVNVRVEPGGTSQVPQRLKGEVHDLGDPVFIAVQYSGDGLAEVTVDLAKNPFTIDAWFKPPSELGPGTYEDVIAIAVCEDEECERHIEGSPKLVPVTYTVGSPLHAEPTSFSLTHVLGSSTRQDSVELSVLGPPAGISWEASASVSWLQPFGRTEGATPDSLVVRIDATGLGPGAHSGNISLKDRHSGEVTQVPVALTVAAPTLTATPGALTFSGPDGTLAPQQLTLSLDTGENAYDWTVTSDTGEGPSWLKVSSTSGPVSSSGTALTVSVDGVGLRGGSTYEGSLTFTTSAGGQTVTRQVPVTLTLPPHRLWVVGNGVALVSTPTVSRLTRTVTVKDTWGPTASTPWSARSSQPWLTVTPGGTGGGELTLTANPAGLTADALHLATVTLSSSDSSVERGELLQVGLWVGSEPPTTSAGIPGLAVQRWETDPVRPYVYLHNGKDLFVYNMYTARRVAELTGLGSYLGSMSVSHDGRTLYVLAENLRLQMLPVDLDTFTVGSPWSPSSESAQQFLYVRPDGHGLLVTEEGQVLEPATGAAVPLVGAFIPNNPDVRLVQASLDGSQACTSNFSFIYCYHLRYLEQGSGSLAVNRRNQDPAGTGSAIYQFAINRDGSRIYLPGGGNYGVAVVDGQTLSELSVLPTQFLENMEVDVDDRFFGNVSQRSIWGYDNAGKLLGETSVPGGVSGFKVSGDGKRFVVVGSNGLRFTNAP